MITVKANAARRCMVAGVGFRGIYVVLFVCFGILYPVYCSMVALETKNTKDDIAWLMYWVIFGLFSITEYFADFILSWFPFYPLFKLGFIMWSVAPVGETGAYYLYKVFVQPFFRMYRGHIDYAITEAVGRTKDAAAYIPAYFN